MLTPKQVDEVKVFFIPSEVDSPNLTAEDLFQGVNELPFPKMTLPRPLVWAYIAAATCEGLLRNNDCHYGKPGQLVPTNRLYTFDKLSSEVRRFKLGRATHEAVGQIYHHSYGKALFADLTFNTDHALGLIGRYLIVKKVLENALLSGKIASIASLACGAGEAVIDAVVKARNNGVNVKAAFFDVNAKALEIAEKQLLSLSPCDNAFYLTNVIKNQEWFSILPLEGLELVGIIDYIPDSHLVNFLRSLKNPRLKLLLSCNILKKPGIIGSLERLFLQHALQWPMYYRTENQIINIFEVAGYSGVHMITEPRSLFSVVVWFR